LLLKEPSETYSKRCEGLSKIEPLIEDFLIHSNLPPQTTYFRRKELAQQITETNSQDFETVSEILYDELETFRKPMYIGGFHVAYSATLDRVSLSKIMNIETTEWLERTHEETIDFLLHKHISSLTPRAFEYFIGQIMRRSITPDFYQVRVSQATRDEGIDVSANLMQDDGSEMRVVVEAKKWAGPIGPAIVDRLVQVMERERDRHETLVKGIIISLNGATPGAIESARGNDIEFWDINTLIRISKEIELGIKYISIPVIDDEWDAYDIET